MEQPNDSGAVNQFWCDVCKVACPSDVNLQTHLLGSKHRLLEKTLKAHGVMKSGSPEPSVSEEETNEVVHKTVVGLGERLEAYRSTEPAVGLEYLLEYHLSGKFLWYECQLCDCEANLTNMFMHVVGAKHRQAYLKKHYPEMGYVGLTGSEAHKKLKNMAAEVEAKDGRKKIQVVTDPQQLKRKYGGEDDGPGAKKDKCIDFTSDDCFLDPAPKSPPPPPPPPPPPQPRNPTFQDLKKAHTEAVKKEGLDKSVDGFGTKKEFLEYLRQFQILCEDDAEFTLKVTQNFTRCLVSYREKVKERAAAAAAAIDLAPPQEVNAAQFTDQNTYTEYPPQNMSGQQAPAPIGHNVYPEYPQRNPRGQEAPVSRPQNTAYNSGPPAFAAPPKPMVPASANVTGLPSGVGPLQNNKATIEFFTSIKNMDAKEVSATLNKIAASNPAFKGIDIPNVIKILQESGSLRSSNKSNSQF